VTAPRVVLDTNVLISGLCFGGKPRRVLELAVEGRIQLFSTAVLIDEFERVMTAKFPDREAAVRDTLDELGLIQRLVPRRALVRLKVIAADPADDRVLECAVAARAGFIVSGDKHLLDLGRFRKIAILSPSDFLRILDTNQRGN
jgi:putative PIN family toxin of toxin-antitoxin system